MYDVIIEDTHLHEDKHDLKGYEKSYKARLAKLFLAHSLGIKRFFVEYLYYENEV